MRTTFSFSTAPFILTTTCFLYLAGHVNQQPISSVFPSPDRRPLQQASFATKADSNTLYLPDDLQATLWAESPMFYNPTNMDVDAQGRVWVTEAVNYRKSNNKASDRLDHPDGERVMILEDTDGDGKADNSKVFVQDPDLVSPMGIAIIGDKVIVSCSPNIVMYTDANGDDKPDKKEIFLTGFGGLDHDHGLHAVTAGPDGRYYVNTGNAGPHVVTDKNGWTLRSGNLFVSGTPYNKLNRGNQVSDDGRVWTGGLALRINPDGSGLKVMAHNFRNSYETALDSYGNMWQSDNDDQTVASRTSWLMEGANAGYFSNDGTRNWQGDQRPGQPIPTAHWHQEDPGIMPVGDITGAGSPTGMVMYEGDELGSQYRGMLLSAEAGRNVIFGYKPEPWGAGYRLQRMDLISTLPKVDEIYKWNNADKDTRKWFRPSDVTVGPDGAIYIADWYDPVVGGHQMQDTKGYGRIYRITPRGKSLKTPQIDLRTTQGQITALLNPAVNVRMLGFDALQEQGEKAVVPVMALLSSPNPFHRARAIFLLAHLGAEGQFEVERLLKAADAPTRLVALRALRSITPENSKANPVLTESQQALLPLLGNLCTDPSVAVRREVAVALRDVPYADCRLMLLNLIKGYDGQDKFYLNALGEAADGKEEALVADLRPMLPKNPVEWDQRTANLIWELHPASMVSLLQKRAEAQTLTADARRQAIVTLGFIKSRDAANAMIDLTKSTDKAIADQATYWTGFRRGNDWAKLLNWDEIMPTKSAPQDQKMLVKQQQLLDEHVSDAEKRKIAAEMSRSSEGARALIGLAADNKLSADLIKAAGPGIRTNKDQTIRTMGKEHFPWKPQAATITTAETSPAVVSTSSTAPRQSASTKATADVDLAPASSSTKATSKPAYVEPTPGKPVEKAVEPEATTAKPIDKPTDLKPASVKTTGNVVEAETTAVKTTSRAADVAPTSARTTDASTSAVAKVAMLTGDQKAGKALFRTICTTCHKHGQQGTDVGPDLTQIHQKLDKNALLDAIIYPSAGIASGYEPWLITTKMGQTYYGFLVSDGEQTVVIKGIKGQKHTIPTNQVASRRQYKTSLMPDPSSMGLTNQQLADLTAFLLKQ